MFSFIPLFLAVRPQETLDYWPEVIICLTLDKLYGGGNKMVLLNSIWSLQFGETNLTE